MSDTNEKILYRPYTTESDLPDIMALVQSELSEPYVIYTYRYFLNQWPHLAFIAHSTSSPKPVGVIVCKQDVHRELCNRGYIAMLSVSKSWRKRGIASSLVKMSIEAMRRDGAEEVILETEADNTPALSLYSSLGFIREKRLYRFYLNGKDAFRLALPFPNEEDTRAVERAREVVNSIVNSTTSGVSGAFMGGLCVGKKGLPEAVGVA